MGTGTTLFRKGATGLTAFGIAVVAGCGGGDSTTTVIQEAPSDATTATTDSTETTIAPEEGEGPTEAEFVAAADRICRRYNPQFEAFTDDTPAYYRLWEESDAKLLALEVPESLEVEFEQYMSALDDQIHFTRTGNESERRAADHRKEEIAREIGFAECGTG